MTERELQIQKIHQLLRSNDKAMVNLAFQLIESHFSFEEVFNQSFPIEEIEYDVKLTYDGELSQYRTKVVLNHLEQLMYSKGLSSGFKRRCSHICVEFLQNIVKLNEINPKPQRIYLEVMFGEKYKIYSTKLVKKELIEDIVRLLSLLNTYSQGELKNLYRDVIKNGNTPLNNSRNYMRIGWIDVRRKAKKPLEYEVQPYDEEYVILKLAVTLDYQ